MFERIAVGTDGSDTAQRAVDRAAELAEIHGAELWLLSAYSGAMKGEVAANRDGGHTVASVLDASRAQVAERSIGLVRTFELEGDPGDALVTFTQDKHPDLLVVGDKGLGGLRGRLLGSVPAKVVHKAACSVLVLRTVSEVSTSD